jgi:ADP-ribose pyrophosphatase
MNTVFEGRVFSVAVGDLAFPDGSSHRVEIVRHPPSVVLLPLQDDGRVILVRQFRATVGREIWELPAGSVNRGEAAEAAAARECEEEIGLVPSRVERIRGLYPSPGFCDEELIFFRVSGLTAPPPDSPHKPDEDEHITARPYTIAEARALVDRGEIVDLKTAYGLTLV